METAIKKNLELNNTHINNIDKYLLNKTHFDKLIIQNKVDHNINDLLTEINKIESKTIKVNKVNLDIAKDNNHLKNYFLKYKKSNDINNILQKDEEILSQLLNNSESDRNNLRNYLKKSVN